MVAILGAGMVRCREPERKFCINDSRGLLLGCNLRQHRWQKFKMLFYSKRWAQFTRGMLGVTTTILATVSDLIGTVSAVATGIKSLRQTDAFA